MTDVSEGMRTLRLQEPPSSLRFWTIVLGLALPATIIVVSFGFVFATTKATGPLLIAPIVALIACGVATLWILRMYRRIGVSLGRDTLVVASGLVTRRFPLSALRAAGVRVVDLDEHVELKPLARTWGIGAPGLSTGWFLLRNRGRALCILTGRERVTVLRADDGIWILLSLADPSALRGALGA
jgi:hypothetical protein